jgi:hypothetical protein
MFAAQSLEKSERDVIITASEFRDPMTLSGKHVLAELKVSNNPTYARDASVVLWPPSINILANKAASSSLHIR